MLFPNIQEGALGHRNFTRNFPVLRGIQARREYFVTQLPLQVVEEFLKFDEAELPAELRAQRGINTQRLPELVNYVVGNRDNYVFSALTASIGYSEEPVEFELYPGIPGESIGNLSIPITAPILVNDGQHRRAAIIEALKLDPTLREESIALVLFMDKGLERSQQIFADLNRYAIRPSASIGILYDHRDPLAGITRTVISQIPWLHDVVEVEKSTLGPRSRKLFTLSALFTGTRSLLNGIEVDDSQLVKIACAFWEGISMGFPDWREISTRRVASAELREQFIYCHGLTLHAMGELGNALLKQNIEVDWTAVGLRLSEIDWRRSNTALWEGRAMVGGRVQKGSQNLVLTANVLRKHLGLRLSEEQENAERALLGGFNE